MKCVTAVVSVVMACSCGEVQPGVGMDCQDCAPTEASSSSGATGESSSQGMQSSSTASSVIMPPVSDDLVVTMTWTPSPDAACHAAQDSAHQCGQARVELRLVAPDGQLGYTLDMSARTQPQDWGEQGSTVDDPVLVEGQYTQTISIPKAISGTYQAYVMLCSDPEDENPYPSVTVQMKDQLEETVDQTHPLNIVGTSWSVGWLDYFPSTGVFRFRDRDTLLLRLTQSLCAN